MQVVDAAALHPAMEQFKAAGDRRQQVVEIMRDTAGQLADRFHLLRLTKQLLDAGESHRGLLLGGDVAAVGVDEPGIRRRRPCDPAVAVILVAKADLVSRHHVEHRRVVRGKRHGRILGMGDGEEVLADQFLRLPAENRRPCRVDGAEYALRIDDADEVLRILPGAITLGSAGRDPCLKRCVERLQLGLGPLPRGDVLGDADQAHDRAVAIAHRRLG